MQTGSQLTLMELELISCMKEGSWLWQVLTAKSASGSQQLNRGSNSPALPGWPLPGWRLPSNVQLGNQLGQCQEAQGQQHRPWAEVQHEMTEQESKTKTEQMCCRVSAYTIQRWPVPE